MKEIIEFFIKQKRALIGILLYFLLVFIFCKLDFITSTILNLSNIKLLGESLKPIIEIVALIIGGLWSYRLFVKNRVDYPLANVTHELTNFRLDINHEYLSLIVTMVNTGKVLIQLDSCQVFIQQILPLHCEIQKLIEESDETDLREGKTENLFSKADAQITWREIGYRKINYEKGSLFIEPGESEIFQYEFILNREVKKIRVITYFHNQKYAHINLGWRKPTLYDLKEESMSEDERNIKSQPEPVRTTPPAKEVPISQPPPDRTNRSQEPPERTPPPSNPKSK